MTEFFNVYNAVQLLFRSFIFETMLALFYVICFSTDLIAINNDQLGQQEYKNAQKLLKIDPLKAINELTTNFNVNHHVKSLEIVADYYLFELHDYSKSYEYANILAQHGHPYGHFIKGVFLSANLTNTPNNIQQSIIHLGMASRDRHLPSLMAMGYRYSKGIGVRESCSKSLQYYKAAAKSIVKHRINGPPLGRLLPPLPIHLEANDGGIYGHISFNKPSDRIFGDESSGISEEDIIDYSKMLADSGDVSSQYLLGQVFYQGLQQFKQNYQIAFNYFKRAASILVLNPNEEQHSKKDLIFAGKSAAMLGRMYLRGEHVNKNNELAMSWFNKGMDVQDGMSYSGLGYMYEYGLNTQSNMNKAIDYYTKAAEKQDAYGLTRLGKHYKQQKDYIGASNYLNIASHLGNVQASYELAQMIEHGHGVSSDCKQAVQLYKQVCESGYEWFYPYTIKGYESLANNTNIKSTLINYLFASEMGVELAQINLAYLIDKKELQHLNHTTAQPPFQLDQLALSLFHRAANQGNVDARIKAGDYHYYGHGTTMDKHQAFEYYKAASDAKSSLAAWNIGYMYENGIGVDQDYNMAMRFYDLTYEYNKDTWLAVSLSNLKLRARWSWALLTKSEEQEDSRNTLAMDTATSNHHDSHENELDGTIEWEIDDMRQPTWKRSHYLDVFTQIEQMFFGSNTTGMDNLVFLGLILVSGYLFYIRRRQELRQRPLVQQQQQQQETAEPNPRLNQLLEQMREQQRQRIIQQDQQEVEPQPPLTTEELRQRRLNALEQQPPSEDA